MSFQDLGISSLVERMRCDPHSGVNELIPTSSTIKSALRTSSKYQQGLCHPDYDKYDTTDHENPVNRYSCYGGAATPRNTGPPNSTPSAWQHPQPPTSIRNKSAPEMTTESKQHLAPPAAGRRLTEAQPPSQPTSSQLDKSKAQTYRTPPPQLTIRCPVTDRLLHDRTTIEVEDDSSWCSNEDEEQKMQDSPPRHSRYDLSADEDDMEDPPALTPRISLNRPQSPPRNPSIYSHLTSEIVSYQKMVAELETLLEPSSHSPEAQWRSRILMRSAQDADRDIWKRLYEYETSFGENPNNSRAQLASRKMHRDFRRVHNGWTSICEQYKQRQHVEVSFLSAEQAPSVVAGLYVHNKKLNLAMAAGEEKEDFFDRAMRERDAELLHIRASVHKVNEIYSDLATLVDGQQEKVDILADNINDSRAYTIAGAEQIHKATHGLLLCAPLNGTCNGISFPDENNGDYEAFPHPHTTKVAREESARTAVRMKESYSSWSMPFGTLQDDFQAVRNDVLEFGREMIQDLSNNPNVKKLGLQCSGCEGGEYQRGVRTETYHRDTVYTPAFPTK